MRKILALFMFLSLGITHLLAQTKTVTGKVTDEKGSPIAHASVLVKGTTTGTNTGTDGSFSLNVPANAKTLVISSLNYTAQELSIGSQNSFSVSLKSATENLDEVIVVGYGTKKKSELTSSIGKVNGDKVANVPLTSVDQVLQGKVAGVNSLTSSGQPGANQQVRIRGIGSVTASAQPLYVVDGVQINSGDLSRLASTNTTNVLASMNPDDIEDISILKDAAAAAIYGSRGANGVILITTKRGKAGKTMFSASAELGNNTYAPIPSDATPLRSDNWVMMLKESILNAGFTQAQADATAANYGAGSGVDVDWLNTITRVGTQQQYQLSAQGGDAKTTFYLSGGYFKQEASTIGSDLKRISAQASFDHKVDNKLSFGLKFAPTYVNQNGPLSNGSQFGNPILGIWFLRSLQNPYNPDGTYNISSATKDFSAIYNPLYIAANDIRKLDRNTINSDVHGTYEIIKNLKFNTKFGVQYDVLEEFQYNNPNHGDGKSVNGRGFPYYSRYFLYDFTNTLDYKKSFLSDNSLALDATLGYEAISSKSYFISAGAQNYSTPVLPYAINAATVNTGSNSGSDYNMASAFGRASLTYKNRYTIYGSVRRDGSSRFGSTNQYGTFPAISGAWTVSKEKFMSNVKFINDLKIKASYGSSGNSEVGNYTWRQTFGYGINYNSQPGGGFNSIGNVDLTWEKNKQTDVGFTASFLKNRINIEFDWYKKVADGLLFSEPLSQTTGFSTITRNIGGMENKGIEFTLNATPVSTKDFTWDLSFNITNNKNQVTQLPSGQTQIISGQNLFKPGYDIQSYYMRLWAGVDPATGNPTWYVDNTKSATTTNYNAAQRVITGQSAAPNVFGGFSNTFTYKNFSLTADFSYTYGNYVYDQWSAYLTDEVNPAYGKYSALLRRWQKPGDITDVPKAVYGSTNFSNSASTRFLYKGDFIRFRNLQVAFNLPDNLAKKMKLTKMQFYVRGTNLWTKTYDSRLTMDPEQGVGGLTNFNILYNKSVTGGLKIDF